MRASVLWRLYLLPTVTAIIRGRCVSSDKGAQIILTAYLATIVAVWHGYHKFSRGRIAESPACPIVASELCNACASLLLTYFCFVQDHESPHARLVSFLCFIRLKVLRRPDVGLECGGTTDGQEAASDQSSGCQSSACYILAIVLNRRRWETI